MLNFLHGYFEIAFPEICICCTHNLEPSEKFLCSFCRNERFESAFSMPENTTSLILPEFVQFRLSMWKFDKGGALQNLLHSLKYNGLYELGVELGIDLGKTLLARCPLQTFFRNHDPILVPVPLHKRRERFRGYNQAEAIAMGVQRVTGWKSVKRATVERTRKTNSQIGLSIDERRENIKDAFKVQNSGVFQNCFPVIIDDVFTTGATTFELAEVLVSEGAGRVAIGTVAQA